MLPDMKTAERMAETHKQKYEFYSKLKTLLESDPGFVGMLVEYLKKEEEETDSSVSKATTIELCLDILAARNRALGSREIMEEAMSRGYLVGVKNPQHAVTSALSTEKKKRDSRVVYKHRKWGLSIWDDPHHGHHVSPSPEFQAQQEASLNDLP